METKKRKQTLNTTPAQYEIYVEEMERDVSFRTGTINPTQPPDYLRTVWENLAVRLNSLGEGPTLNADDWKKVMIIFVYTSFVKYK